MESIGNNYLTNAQKMLRHYKAMADKTIAQVTDEQLHWQYNAETNSIAIIMQHMAGNSISRYTDFLTSDGEKPWRNRDSEFEVYTKGRAELLAYWKKGWQCGFDAIATLTENDLSRVIYIRNEPHTVIEALNRHLMHLAYHVGQIVFVAKMLTGEQWQTLSIAKGQSKQFNAEKLNKK